MKNKTHLIIPDCHIKPNESLKRIEKLSEFAYQLKPDLIIDLGDFADMASLSSYEKFKENSYKEDIEIVNKAQEIFNKPWKFNKKKNPKKFRLIGNHEHRVTRFIKDYPEFKDFISLRDLNYDQNGWEFINYEGSSPGKLTIDGITYAHFLTHQNSSQAISGQHHASALLNKKHCSSTVGHSHLFDYKIQTTGEGKKIHGLVAGCFFESFKSYAGLNNYGFTKGVAIKTITGYGQYDLEWVSMERILAL